MNQGHVAEELLQRYFDGDLQASQADGVARHLGDCPECSARHGELAALRRMLEVTAEEAMRGVDFDALYEQVERGVRDQRSAPGLLERLSIWVRDLAEQQPSRLWVPACTALAAVVVVVGAQLRSATHEPALSADRRGLGPSAQPEQAREEPAGEDPLRESDAVAVVVSSEIVQVDFGGSVGTVYEIALANGASTPVVWINDDVQ